MNDELRRYNILVTGSNGQLGKEIRQQVLFQRNIFENNKLIFFFTTKEQVDITDKEAIEKFIKTNNINIIINCAAYTAVDRAEVENDLANIVNHIAVKYLAEISRERNISLIHISTDYVFDGKNYKPYMETDITNPQNIYGKTKLAGEKAIQSINPLNSLIIRTSWVYSEFGNNFVKRILHLGKKKDLLKVINDQIGSPTYAKDLAKTILQIVKYLTMNTKHKLQIYHYSNEGVCSWYDFAKAIFEIKNINIEVNPIESKYYPAPAKRPYYSVMNKSKIKNEFNIEISYWKDSLKECLERL